MKRSLLLLLLAACAGPGPTPERPVRSLRWASTVQERPTPEDVPDAGLRTALLETGLPWRVKHSRTGIELVLIPAGTYRRGAPEKDRAARPEERPAHRARVSEPFYLARTETTQAQWAKLRAKNPSEFPGPDRPVENVTVEAIHAFCAEAGVTLPTEVQWEWACRAGSSRARDGEPDELAWYAENSGRGTHPVATRAPNGFGLHDMLGNVWELTRGDWSLDGYAAFAKQQPVDEADERRAWKRRYYQSFRGGSWISPESDLRASRRQRFSPGYGFYEVGFRVARLP